MSGDKGISAFPDGDTLLTWVATVTGPDETVYEGMIFSFGIVDYVWSLGDVIEWACSKNVILDSQV